jgi:hypothetical protein
MIQWFYTELGFAGTILVALFIFVLFILWLAGIAGIAGRSNLPSTEFGRYSRLVLGVIFPFFPIAWSLVDIRRQHLIIKGSRRASYDSN